MKLAIFETEHSEVCHALVEFFDDGSHDIILFVYEESYRQLVYLLGAKFNTYTWVIKKRNESRQAFIYRLYIEIRRRNIQLVCLNTIADNFILYACLVKFLRGVRFILTIHAINGFLCNSAEKGFRIMLRNAGKKLLARFIKEFSVISQTMAMNLSASLPPGRKCYCIPGGVYRPHALTWQSISEEIRIVVPGTVDPRRRDYQLVFDLLEGCAKEGIPLRLILLGGFFNNHSEGLLPACRQYASHYLNFLYYEDAVVDQPEFDRQMQLSHLVLVAPVISTRLVDGIEEIYGQTVCSGNMFDVVRYAKPFLAPRMLEIDSFLSDSCLRYDSLPDIISCLKHLLRDQPAYGLLCERALAASLQYTVAGVRKRNADLFNVA